MEEQDLGRYVHILSRQIKKRIDESVSIYDVTSVQCAILGFINRESKKGDVFAKDIEGKFNMSRATIAEILSLMEKNNLIERRADTKDARLKKIVLKKKALDIQNSVNKEIRKVEKEMKKGLTEKEVEEFVYLISKISDNLKK